MSNRYVVQWSTVACAWAVFDTQTPVKENFNGYAILWGTDSTNKANTQQDCDDMNKYGKLLPKTLNAIKKEAGEHLLDAEYWNEPY